MKILNFFLTSLLLRCTGIFPSCGDEQLRPAHFIAVLCLQRMRTHHAVDNKMEMSQP